MHLLTQSLALAWPTWGPGPAGHPNWLARLDTFYIGKLKGVGKVWTA